MAWEERARARLASDEPERCRTIQSITAFFPAYNDAPTIGGLVAFTDAVLSRVTADYEILVVNDASPDGMAAVLAALGERFPCLKVVTHPTNRGYGGALQFGLKVRDVDCDFRLVRRATMQQIHLVSMKGSICCEMIKKLQRVGCRIVEVPVHHYPRVWGRSQFFQFSKVVQSLGMLLRLWVDMVLAPALRALPLRRPFQRRVPVDAGGPE